MKFISNLTHFYEGCIIHTVQFSVTKADGTAFVSSQNGKTTIHSSKKQRTADPWCFDWCEPGIEAGVSEILRSMTWGDILEAVW